MIDKAYLKIRLKLEIDYKELFIRYYDSNKDIRNQWYLG